MDLRVALLVLVVLAAPLGSACSSGTTNGADVPTDASGDRMAPGPTTDDDAGQAVTGPTLLSQTGLYSDFASRTVAADLWEYTPRIPFRADGAEKRRWLSLPAGSVIDNGAIDHWEFPVGTKVFKEFKAEGKVVETRLLMKVRNARAQDGWWMAAYVWKDDGSDAIATLDGAEHALGTAHDVPPQTDCINCHQDVRDVVIGVSALQLGDPGATPRPIDALALAGKLAVPPPADLDIPGAGNVKDALGYLHANCGHCHNDEAVRLATQTKMRLRLLVAQRTPEATGAYTTTIGTTMRHPLNDGGVTTVLVPGSPDQSGLWVRMNQRGTFGMPPAGTNRVDTTGAETLRQWIAAFQ